MVECSFKSRLSLCYVLGISSFHNNTTTATGILVTSCITQNKTLKENNNLNLTISFQSIKQNIYWVTTLRRVHFCSKLYRIHQKLSQLLRNRASVTNIFVAKLLFVAVMTYTQCRSQALKSGCAQGVWGRKSSSGVQGRSPGGGLGASRLYK